MMDKRLLILTFALSLCCACAQVDTNEGTNVAEERELRSWMALHYPGTPTVAHGIYVLEDIPGTGADVADGNYVYEQFEIRNYPDFTVKEYSSEHTAKHLLQYNQSYDYSPGVLILKKEKVCQGILDLICGGSSADGKVNYPRMKIGGSRTVVIPGWLTSTNNYYETEKEYLANVTGTNVIYSLTAADQTGDIFQYQIDSIINVGKGPVKWGGTTWTAADSVATHKGHLFYKRDMARESQRGVSGKVRPNYKFPKDTTIYIDYTGRLLNGKVFDTTHADTARQYGIYSSTSSYSPVPVLFSSDSTALTINSSTVIKGFSLSIWHMHPYESARAIFTSDYGYGEDGAGNRIGEYAPLLFDIDVVAKPQ